MVRKFKGKRFLGAFLSLCMLFSLINITMVNADNAQIACIYGSNITLEQPSGTYSNKNLADLGNPYTKGTTSNRGDTDYVLFLKTPQGGWTGSDYIEMNLEYVSNVTGVHLAQLEYQRVGNCRIDYLDENDLVWKTAVTNPTLTNVGSTGISTTDITFGTSVKTARLRFYIMSGEGGGANERLRLISLWPVGETTTDKMNGNLLYGSKVYWNGTEKDVATIDGNFQYDGVGCALTMSSGRNGELEYVFTEAKTFNKIELTHQYEVQGINQGYVEAWINGEYKKIADIPNQSAFSSMYNQSRAKAKRVVINLPYAVSTEKLKIVVTSAANGATGVVSVNQCMVLAEDIENQPKLLSDKLTAASDGNIITFDYISPFSADVICFDGVKAGTACIGYMQNGAFIEEVQVALSEGDNTYIYQNAPERQSLAIRVTFDDSTYLTSANAIRIYGFEPYSQHSEAVKAFESSKKYSDYEAANTLVSSISDAQVKGFFEGLLAEALLVVTDSQQMTVADYSPITASVKISGTAFVADGSMLTLTITDSLGGISSETLEVTDGAFEETVSLSGLADGVISFSIAAYNKQLTGSVVTRQAYSGTQLLSFVIDGASANMSGNSFALVLPTGSTLNQRIAIFEASEGARVYLGGTLLESGITVADYAQSNSIRVLAENGTEQVYTVDITIPVSSTTQTDSSLPKKLTGTKNVLDISEENEAVEENTDFTDVSKEHWAYQSIEILREKGVVSGIDEKHFAPDREVKREELVTMLSKCIDIKITDDESDFVDAKGTWASKYIAAMTKEGYLSGISENEFGVGRNITREDLCVIIYRVLQGQPSDNVAESFSDEEMISDYAFDAVMFMKEKGYIVGVDNEFMPKKSLTRAEAAKILSVVFFDEM